MKQKGASTGVNEESILSSCSAGVERLVRTHMADRVKYNLRFLQNRGRARVLRWLEHGKDATNLKISPNVVTANGKKIAETGRDMTELSSKTAVNLEFPVPTSEAQRRQYAARCLCAGSSDSASERISGQSRVIAGASSDR